MISLDHHATTPTDPSVLRAMEPFFCEQYWNPNSPHSGGERAARAVERARAKLAELIDAAPAEIVFTSGATEANNLALLGTAYAALAAGIPKRRILTSCIEHKSVLETASHLRALGFEHGLIPVRSSGELDVDALRTMIADDVLFISVMAANNEIGIVQPVDEVAGLAAEAGALFHTDAAQVAGRIPVSVLDIGCDLLSLSGHKMYGPNGIGALYVSAASGLRPQPIMFGGGQEQGLRPGTLPVPLIVGLGSAAELAASRLAIDDERLRRLTTLFLAELDRRSSGFSLNGAAAPRLPGSLNLRFWGIDAEEVLLRLGHRLHLSTGSACTSGELQGSYVLAAIGLSPAEIASSLRICFGREHSEADAVAAANVLAEAVNACENATGGGVQQREGQHGKVHGTGFPAAVCRT
jgi:cysteine desulfurase